MLHIVATGIPHTEWEGRVNWLVQRLEYIESMSVVLIVLNVLNVFKLLYIVFVIVVYAMVDLCYFIPNPAASLIAKFSFCTNFSFVA
jgi:hypothetical protein